MAWCWKRSVPVQIDAPNTRVFVTYGTPKLSKEESYRAGTSHEARERYLADGRCFWCGSEGHAESRVDQRRKQVAPMSGAHPERHPSWP